MGYQASEAQELMGLVEDMCREQEVDAGRRPSVVICSDLNSLPGSEAYALLARSLRDASLATERSSYPEGHLFLFIVLILYYLRTLIQHIY